MPVVEVSYGELLDRYSIALIKKRLLSGLNQKQAEAEAERLSAEAMALLGDKDVGVQFAILEKANLEMWNSMESIYAWSGPKDALFNSIILSIIETNKSRAVAKREIDLILNSKILEAKSFF